MRLKLEIVSFKNFKVNKVYMQPKHFVAIGTAALLISTVLIISIGLANQKSLKERARDVFEINGVVYLDETDGGTLEVGVVDKGLTKLVEKKLNELGIPLDKVRIVKTKPIVEMATLRDEVRPIEGGIQIAFTTGRIIKTTYLCTLGFNAKLEGIEGFVTNSHCTAEEFEEDGTVHHQPLPDNPIGQEVKDPEPFRCGVFVRCRYSDAAFSQKLETVASSLGSIAMTSGVNDGSLDIVGSYKIVGKHEGNAEEGIILTKVGRTTGTTQGVVTKTCVDVRPLGSRVVRLCQDIVEADVQIVGGGDSGSPVFRVVDDSETPEKEVILYGILWGGSEDGKSFVYSPISNVEADLGTLVIN